MNLARVVSLAPTGNGEYQVRLTTGTTLTLTRGFKEPFERQIGWRF